MIHSAQVDRLGLAKLPDVAGVSVLLESQKPRLTVIHLADWHFVPREVFAADERTHDADVTDEQIDERYAAFLDEVAAVQKQQRAVLSARYWRLPSGCAGFRQPIGVHGRKFGQMSTGIARARGHAGVS